MRRLCARLHRPVQHWSGCGECSAEDATRVWVVDERSSPAQHICAMFDIFLSYADEDRPKARALAQSLQAVGWSVWWDRRIPSGRSWRDAIEAAIGEMRCMVVLWSRHSIDSDWVCEEADEGRKRSVLAPVLIERVEPPLGFRSIQAADLTEWDGAADAPGLRQLFNDLEALVGKPVGQPAAAIVPAAAKAPFGRRRAVALAATAIAGVALVAALGGLWSGRKAELPAAQKPTLHEATQSTAPAKPAAEVAVPPAEPAARDATATPSDVIVAPTPTHPARDASASTASATPDAVAPRPRSTSRPSAPRCAAIVERQSLGERPSPADLDFLNKECR